jgi:hypothetical protein
MSQAPQESYPLSWPEGWKKPAFRRRSNFGNSDYRGGPHTIEKAREFVFSELRRLGARSIILSSNLRLRLDGLPISGQSQPADPSVAIYFTLKEKPHVLACGEWDRAQDNLWAIGKHIEALRGQGRWGVGSIERRFTGYTAIPEKTGGVSWWEILGVAVNATEEQIAAAYKAKAKIFHPDAGSAPDHEAMVRLNEAYTMATNQRAAK